MTLYFLSKLFWYLLIEIRKRFGTRSRAAEAPQMPRCEFSSSHTEIEIIMQISPWTIQGIEIQGCKTHFNFKGKSLNHTIGATIYPLGNAVGLVLLRIHSSEAIHLIALWTSQNMQASVKSSAISPFRPSPPQRITPT